MFNSQQATDYSSDSLEINPPPDRLSLFMSAGGGCLTDVEQIELWESIRAEEDQSSEKKEK